MKNLTTRKIILGLLMAFVLAFGVQRVADAVRDPKLQQSSSDFFKFRTPNTTFSIRVSLPFDTPENSETAGETVTITFSSGITPIGIFQGESSPVTLTEKGGRDADSSANRPVSAANGNEYSFGDNRETNSTTITIEGRFNNTGSQGEQTVEISSTGWTEGNTDGGESYTYYYYVSKANAAAADTDIPLSSTLGTFTYFNETSGSGYATEVYGGSTSQIFAGDSQNVPVLYGNRSRLQMSHENYKSNERVSLPGSGPIASNFAIHLRDNTSTDVVTTQLRGDDRSIITGVYIYGHPELEVDGLTRSEKGAMENPGKPGEVIQNAFTARVKDERGSAVPGVPVSFDKIGGTDPDVDTNPGTLIFGSGNTGTLVNQDGDLIILNGNPITAGSGDPLYVRTNSSGRASVNFRLGDGESTVAISAVGQVPKNEKAYGGSRAGKELSALRIREGIEDNTFDLYALVTYDGEPVDPEQLPAGFIPTGVEGTADVIFSTDDGTLANTSTPAATDLPVVTEVPNTDGIAEVKFTWDGSSSNPEVTASLQETIGGITRDVRTVTFNITGSSGQPATPPTPPVVQQRNRLIISTTGEGTTRSVTVNALTTTNTPIDGLSVLLNGTALTTPQRVTTGTAATITLPSASGNYTLIATDSTQTFDTGTLTVTVSAPGTLSPTLGTRAGNQQPITVRAVRGGSAQSGVNITITGGATSTSRQTDASGSASAIITLPTATSAHTLTVRAPGYSTAQVTVPAPEQQTEDDAPPTTTRGTGGVADSIQISGQPFQTGTANTQLDLPLSVRVLDGNDVGVENVRATFRVKTGKGRLSQRGNGQGFQTETDRSGYARAFYTPLADGTSTVLVKAAGVTQTVTFTITANGASDTGMDTGASETPEDTNTSEPEAPLSMEVSLKVNASNRPVIYWIAGGALYRQGTGDATQIAASAQDVVVDTAGGKLYYIEQTSNRSGTVHRANLDGMGAEVVQRLTSAPQGLALDTATAKLYLTNGWGKIQRMNLDGTQFETNFLTGLSDPMHIAVADGNVYWTQAGGSVRAASISGAKTPRDIVTGAEGLTGLAAGGGKVFWTEQTGKNRGRVASANPDGTGVAVVHAVTASVYGLAMDPATHRLYWTNGWGKVQRSANATRYQDVATGLMLPTAIAIGGANTATTPTPKATTTATNKYDVTGDGTVDVKDSDVLIVAVAAGATDAKYDVTGDGKVDINDIVAVTTNRSGGAAGAPTLLGRTFSAIERDALQEQIELLIATNDRSPAAMRTLVYLQQLIVMARPEKTQLLANYPNPFNPETWMPYELATDTDVRITIYNAQGVVIRTLQLGQQSAGYYTDRERAAYWDGRNAFGEQVASGVYFYQLETDTMSALRKMVIRK